jgi:hypothetical protein
MRRCVVTNKKAKRIIQWQSSASPEVTQFRHVVTIRRTCNTSIIMEAIHCRVCLQRTKVLQLPLVLMLMLMLT